jgi:hypothetical protein
VGRGSFSLDIEFEVVGIELGDDGTDEIRVGEWGDGLGFISSSWDQLYQLLEQVESSRFGCQFQRFGLSLGWRNKL